MNSIPQSSQQLVELLKSKSLHISAAESCTAASSLPLSPASPAHPALWSMALSPTLPLPK